SRWVASPDLGGQGLSSDTGTVCPNQTVTDGMGCPSARNRFLIARGVNTTGVGFVASFDRPARAIRCGQVIVDATRALGIELRMGLHTGECEVRGNDLGGLAVHIAARIG